MVLYGITLVLLPEKLKDSDPTLLLRFYANDAAFDGSTRRSAAQLCMIMERGPDQGKLPMLANYLFIVDNLEEKGATRKEFKQAGLNLYYIDCSRYLKAYLGPREELEEWVRPKVEAWAHKVCTISKKSKQYTQLLYDGLGMLLQIKWQYPQMTVPGVGSLMVLI